MSRFHERLDKVFSPQVLGAVFVGSTAGKIVEKIIELHTATTLTEMYGWIIAFFFAVLLFIYWNRLERRVESLYTDDDE